MLPSFSNELRIALCPDRVILLGLGKGLRRKVAQQTILPCVPVPGVPAWRPALDALEQWLNTNEMGRTNVTVILSSHFVRYALMPFSEEVTRTEEEQALAQILLEDIYGDPAQQWRLKIAEGGYGEPRLIAAVDAGLLDVITELTASASLKLTSIKPYLMAAFNRFREQLREKSGLFALVESGQLVLLSFKSEKLSGVRRMPLNGNLNEQLPDLLLREMLLNGMEAADMPVYLYVAGRPDFNLPSNSSMSFQTLQRVDKGLFALSRDIAFDMACIG